ncbi:MAG: hypothetical protein KDB53_09970, partial [Planctomycetes bacterium]|nr:hypothetical protein [Planctomycetota bacterium]
MTSRILWSLLLCIPFGLAGLQDQDEDEAEPSASGRVEVARLMKTCKKCHLDQWAEWQSSRHGQSWANPVLQAAIKERDDQGEACARCHAPDSLFVKGPGELPDARTDDRALGVNCTTCHNSPTRYHGPFPSEGHGGVIVDAAYLESKICESCHGHPEANAMHEQFTTYRDSPAAKDGKRCQDCHMKEVDRQMARGRRKLRNVQKARSCRTHVFEAAHTTGKADGAATLEVRSHAGQLSVAIEPRSGHGFPASEGRELRLKIAFHDDAGLLTFDPHQEVFVYPKRMVLPGQ